MAQFWRALRQHAILHVQSETGLGDRVVQHSCAVTCSAADTLTDGPTAHLAPLLTNHSNWYSYDYSVFANYNRPTDTFLGVQSVERGNLPSGVLNMTLEWKPLPQLTSKMVQWMFGNLHKPALSPFDNKTYPMCVCLCARACGGNSCAVRAGSARHSTACATVRALPHHAPLLVSHLPCATPTPTPNHRYWLLHPTDHITFLAQPADKPVGRGSTFTFIENPGSGCRYQRASFTEPWVCPANRTGFTRATPEPEWAAYPQTNATLVLETLGLNECTWYKERLLPHFGKRVVVTSKMTWEDTPRGLVLRASRLAGVMAPNKTAAFERANATLLRQANEVVRVAYLDGNFDDNITASAYAFALHWGQEWTGMTAWLPQVSPGGGHVCVCVCMYVCVCVVGGWVGGPAQSKGCWACGGPQAERTSPHHAAHCAHTHTHRCTTRQ
jgi:hypothetical protein